VFSDCDCAAAGVRSTLTLTTRDTGCVAGMLLFL
jgi:hypothetical protein